MVNKRTEIMLNQLLKYTCFKMQGVLFIVFTIQAEVIIKQIWGAAIEKMTSLLTNDLSLTLLDDKVKVEYNSYDLNTTIFLH
jgi:hypothetical protein